VDPGGSRLWKVGELARATGLTVRALHHYDEIGLFVPSERTAVGHRLYAERDLGRLYRILALRRLGLRLEEIAAVLDDDGASLLETVRRHLEQVERDLEHQRRLRERLRELLDALERSVAPSAAQFIETLEAMTAVEATVKDVLVWRSHIDDPPPDKPLPHPPREGQQAVLLDEYGGERVLVIWIGRPEGTALAHALSGQSTPRPLTYDLAAALLEAGDLRVERVVVETVRDFTFYATIVVAGNGEPQEVDARPSDALNLAVRVGAPVFIASELIDQAGARPAQLPFAGTEWQPPPRARGTEPATEERVAKPIGEWHSLLTDTASPPEGG
jgi:bifunctional DNase/RNase/DNA-binding transcriptional MerR regulator